MFDHEEFVDDSIGEMDLTDLEMQDVNGGTITPTPTIVGTVTLALCTRGTLCGTCGSVGSTGCC
ncbi:hypothetical protein AB0A95_27075 [Micromonospora sp. NPDC049230]|uniref:hypothetical protein n=1 Tax=Micromonospora sp. NPDC049230 TaxID=3155502 RepID=UPI0033ED2683